jgi:hypothetical protein
MLIEHLEKIPLAGQQLAEHGVSWGSRLSPTRDAIMKKTWQV